MVSVNSQNTITLEHAAATCVQIVIGYGRMGQHCMDVYPRLNRVGAVIVVDAEPGRAEAGAERLQSLGVEAKHIEAPIEEVKIVERGERTGGRVVMNWMIDRPGPVAWGLRQYPNFAHQVQFYTRMPNGVLYGKSAAVRAGDRAMQSGLADFFDAEQRVTARTGSEHIWGVRGRAEHRIAEPLYRAWNRELLLENLQRLISGRELSGDPVQITDNGREGMPLFIHNHRDGWRSPEELIDEIFASSNHVLIRGSQFAIGEIGPDSRSVRIHRARLRKLDGRFSHQGFSTLSREAIEAALRQSERWLATGTNPLVHSD